MTEFKEKVSLVVKYPNFTKSTLSVFDENATNDKLYAAVQEINNLQNFPFDSVDKVMYYSVE